MKICKNCHKEFPTTRANKIYCSTKCGEEYRYEHNDKKTSERKERRQKRKVQAELKRCVHDKARFNAIAKMQSETGIGYGYLVPIWEDKVKLANYIKLHRTR